MPTETTMTMTKTKKNKKHAFVLMPFSGPINKYYNGIFKPTLEKEGFVVRRADDLNTPKPIIDDIRRLIKKADLILCELTGLNPNVLYELGMAHAIGKAAIMVTQNMSAVPFNLKHLRIIDYDPSHPNWVKLLTKRIEKCIKELLTSHSDKWPQPLLQTNTNGNVFPQNKISLLRWNGLTTREQTSLYQKYLRLAPRHHKPQFSTVPIGIQKKLNKLNPIDIKPLQKFLKKLSLSINYVRLPITAEQYEYLHEKDKKVIERLSKTIRNGLSATQCSYLRKVYDYLACSELLATARQKQSADVVLVSGARWSHQHRIDEAIRVFTQSGCAFVLSGGCPEYDKDKHLPIAEADAMHYYLTAVKRITDKDAEIYVERRPRNTRETVFHSMEIFQCIRQKKKRPINVCLVTSSYHMRRLYLTMRLAAQARPDLIKKIFCATAPTTIDWNVLLTASKNSKKRRKFAFGAYVSEYFKLLGGRATGEF